MSTSPLHCDRAHLIGNLRFEPVVITANVKNHDPVSQETRRCVSIFDVLGQPPTAAFDVLDPVFDPLSRVNVLLDECEEFLLSNYFHAYRP